MATTLEAMRGLSALCDEAAPAGLRDWRDARAALARGLAALPADQQRAIREALRTVLRSDAAAGERERPH